MKKNPVQPSKTFADFVEPYLSGEGVDHDHILEVATNAWNLAIIPPTDNIHKECDDDILRMSPEKRASYQSLFPELTARKKDSFADHLFIITGYKFELFEDGFALKVDASVPKSRTSR